MARWIVALIGAFLVLLIGGSCVNLASGYFLDPMWEAPFKEDLLQR